MLLVSGCEKPHHNSGNPCRSRARAPARARPREFCLSRGQSDETKIVAEGSGSLFGAEVPQIEHEHDDDDSRDFGIWAS